MHGTAYAMYDQYLRLSRMKKALIILLVLLPLCLSGQMVRSSVTYAISADAEPSLGDELCTNTGFATDDYWEIPTPANVSITGGVCVVNGLAAWNTIVAQGNEFDGYTVDTVEGHTYRVTFDITDYSAGSAYVSLSGTNYTDEFINGNGAYSYDIVAGAGNQVRFGAYDAACTFNIDNVSVREVL